MMKLITKMKQNQYLIVHRSDCKKNRGVLIWKGKKEDYKKLRETREWRCRKCDRILAKEIDNDIITVKGEGDQKIKIRFKAIQCNCPGLKRKGTEGCNTDNRLVSHSDILSEKHEPILPAEINPKIQKEVEESRNRNIQKEIEKLSNL